LAKRSLIGAREGRGAAELSQQYSDPFAHPLQLETAPMMTIVIAVVINTPCFSMSCTSGGATKSDLWLQIHADISNIPLHLTE
jgi:hypothetical protein